MKKYLKKNFKKNLNKKKTLKKYGGMNSTPVNNSLSTSRTYKRKLKTTSIPEMNISYNSITPYL